MRVLQLHNRYLELGGEDSVVDAEAGLLQGSGHEVVQFGVSNPVGGWSAAGSLMLSSWNPFSARRVVEEVARGRPDVAHVHNTWYSLSPSVVRALRGTGVPVVMTLHNYRLVCANAMLFREGSPCELCLGTHPWRGMGYRCYRDSYLASGAAATMISANRLLGTWDRAVDLFVVMTEFSKRMFVEGGLPADRIVVKPHFVEDLGEREAPPSSANSVLYVGRLAAEKGVGTLVDAWEVDPPEGLELLVVGEGPLRAELEARQVPGVRLTGRLSGADVHQLMRTARALMFPSLLNETFGMVLIEAMAAGLPVFASRLGGTQEVLNPGDSRQLVDPGDQTAWSAAIDTVTDITLVDQLGSRARATYQQRYTSTVALANLQNIYTRARKLARNVII